MKTVQKLKLIQSLSGLTQEKLALELGVSFPTVNSWLKERSVPRKGALKRIESLYSRYTGQKTMPDDILSAKREIIKTKARKHKNILQFINDRKDIYDQFALSLTYNTNRIEGSTLTEAETAAILFDGVTFSNKKLVEHMEVKNHQAALTYLFSFLLNKKSIDENLILKLHSILLNGIQQDAGYYRKHGVRIVGADVPTANYLKIPQLMKILIEDIQKTNKNIMSHVSDIHSLFEQIHPFSDGNGRIGRLLIHAMLLKKNIPPAIIKQKKKRSYLSCLNKAQTSNDPVPLEEFLCDAVLESFLLIEQSE